MIAALRLWFTGRSRREQWLLLVMAALLAITLVWAAIILPVSDGLVGARTRYADAIDRLGQTRAELASLRGLGGGAPARFVNPLDVELRTRAEAAGFTLTQDDLLSGGQVHIAIASAKATALFGWIAGLEEAGLLVEQLKVTAGGDGTVAVDATFVARGG